MKIIGQKIKGIDTYFGGKGASGTYQQIINCIRPHDLLVTPCLGNGHVTRNIKAAAHTIGNDLNSEVIDLWKAMNFDWIELLTGDAFELLEKVRDQIQHRQKTVVYIDPPYPLHSRKSDRHIYKYEMTDLQHVKLAMLANTLSCDVLISTYENNLYDAYLRGWTKKTWTAMTRQGPATEVLYMNYSEIDELHDYSYLGANYRERERIAKKVKRMVNKMQSLPQLERLAILNAISH